MYEKFLVAVNRLITDSATSAYIAFERYWNDGSPSGFHLGVQEQYSPSSGAESFRLPIYARDRFQCTQVGNLRYAWSEQLIDAGLLPLPVHPDVESHIIGSFHEPAMQPRFYIDVVPTASGRTVLHRDEPTQMHFIKLHYPSVLGRYKRDLPLYKWQSGLENSREMSALQSRFPSSLGYLHEPFGTYFHTAADNQGFGAIYRELMPRPQVFSESVLIPGFALFASRRPQGVQKPLLIQLLDGVESPLDAFIEAFIVPTLHSYTFLACECGLIPECNAQNVLYEIDLATGKTRFIIRDMTDMFKDLTLREALHLHTSFCTYKSIDRTYDQDYYLRRSFEYDFKLGEYLLRPLARCLSDWCALSFDMVLEAIRSVACDAWSRYDNSYFSSADKWYGYPKLPAAGRDSYIEFDDPTFR